jgi:hypothetical protein
MVRNRKIARNRFPSWRLSGLLLSLCLATFSGRAAETAIYYYTNDQGTPLATADAIGSILSTFLITGHMADRHLSRKPGGGVQGTSMTQTPAWFICRRGITIRQWAVLSVLT